MSLSLDDSSRTTLSVNAFLMLLKQIVAEGNKRVNNNSENSVYFAILSVISNDSHEQTEYTSEYGGLRLGECE